MTPEQLRASILQYAMQGKLTEQCAEDGSVDDLLAQIAAEKEQLILDKKIKRDKELPPISEDEVPFQIPANWKWVRIGRVFQIGSSSRVQQSEWASSGIPFYRAREIVSLANNTEIKNPLYISKETFAEKNKKSPAANSGDVMITGVGTLGTAWIVPDNTEFYYKDASVLKISGVPQIKSEYLLRFIQSPGFMDQVLSSSAGTAVGTLTIKSLNNLLIPVPPLAEQERIVTVLSQVLNDISRFEAISRRLDMLNDGITDSLKKAAIYRLLTGSADISQGDLELPEGWKLNKIGDHVNFGTTVVQASDLPEDGWLLDLEDVQKRTGKILTKKTVKQGVAKSSKNKFQAGQVLYSKLRPYLKKVLVAPAEGFATSEMLTLSPNETLSAHFLRYWLTSPYIDGLVNAATYGTKMPRANIKILKNLPIVIPPIKQQIHIVNQIESII